MNERIEAIIDTLKQLQEERENLLKIPLALPNTWIHEYNVKRYYPGSGTLHSFTYAKWQASEAIFERNPKKFGHRGQGQFTKNKHIGRVGSTSGLGMDEAVFKAYQSLENRRRLDAIDKAIEEIEKALQKVMPLET
ncbi:hypothetical protein [Anabaena azotica]|uniref:Uncharacterized protein n=1 Tax=Anabaena azotica FACHB-119 TaxID=947527 RepID=A0ABR8DF77_9NOST|nr:hypothetical protein [Anabaena azotica]MBD2505301.1 hypothetical protein [Anabaena azotica FACHB-119]